MANIIIILGVELIVLLSELGDFYRYYVGIGDITILGLVEIILITRLRDVSIYHLAFPRKSYCPIISIENPYSFRTLFGFTTTTLNPGITLVRFRRISPDSQTKYLRH